MSQPARRTQQASYLAKDNLQKSMVDDNESGKSIPSEFRTSSGMFLQKAQEVSLCFKHDIWRLGYVLCPRRERVDYWEDTGKSWAAGHTLLTPCSMDLIGWSSTLHLRFTCLIDNTRSRIIIIY